MTALAQRVLERFPAHLEAGDRDKQLFHVASGLAVSLEQLQIDVGEVRRSHRLGDARVATDVGRLAGLHGLSLADFEVLFARRERAGLLAEQLEAAADDAAREELAEALCDLWGLAAARPRLALFDADASTPSDLGKAAAALVSSVRATLGASSRLAAVTRRVEQTCFLHASGNATVETVLRAVANLLDLDVDRVEHSEDRFWHAAAVRDRLRLGRPVDDEGTVEPLAVAEEILGLEENPQRRLETGRFPRRHGELFSVLRRGFGPVRLQVRVFGTGERTLGPLLVNRDEGRGVGYVGAVGLGQTLVFSEEGRVTLDGSDVTPQCFSWVGACFASDDATVERDFVFAPSTGSLEQGRVATFAVAQPIGSLKPNASFPHAGHRIENPGVAIGETRFAFFVQKAHFAGGPFGSERIPAPRPFRGNFDGSVFCPNSQSPEPSAEVELSWLEHEAYAFRVLLPKRFENMQLPDRRPIQEMVGRGLRRFKPAGVDARIEFVEDRWVLGRGVLGGEEGVATAAASRSLIDEIRSGARTWSDAEVSPSVED